MKNLLTVKSNEESSDLVRAHASRPYNKLDIHLLSTNCRTASSVFPKIAFAERGYGKNGPGKKGPGKKGPVKTVPVKTVLGKNGPGKNGPTCYNGVQK